MQAGLALLVAGLLAAVLVVTLDGSSQPRTTPKPLIHKAVYQSATGSDSTCKRNLRSLPCLTVTRACALSRLTDFIVKIGQVPSRFTHQAACVGPPPGTCSSVTQYTISFTFSKALPCGQFVNGDWWVTPATGDTTACITGMTPAYTTSPGRNGYMVNPTGLISGNFDDRLSGYNAATVPALPDCVVANTSVIKAISTPGTCCTSPTHVPAVNDVSVLTVLGSVPTLNGATTFRPSYFGGTTNKRLFTTAALQTGLLPSVAPVSAAPTLAQVAARFQHAQLDTIQSFAGRYIHPSNSFFAFSAPATNHDYGGNIGQDNTDAIMRLYFNDSIPTKMSALVNVVQAGIDWYGLRKAGMCWSADGGHFQGRKIMIVFAGVMLGDSDMQNSVSSVVSGGCYAEDGHSYFSSAAGVSGRQYFTGAAAGMALFGKVCPTGTYQTNQNLGGSSGAKDCKDPGGFIDGGDVPGGDYMETVTVGGSYIAQSMAVRLMPSLRSVWNNETFIQLEDRWVDFGTWASPDPSAPRVCQGTRSPNAAAAAPPILYCSGTGAPGPTSATPPSPGAYLGLHGTTQGGVWGFYSNAFEQNMWSAYRATIGDTFCGTAGC